MHYSDRLAYSSPPTPISAPPLQSYQGGYSGRQGNSQHQSSRAIVPTPVATLPTQSARGRGQAARGRGQAVRGGGQAVRGGDQPARGRPKDVVQGGGAQPRCYAFPAIHEAESSDVVITGTVSVCSKDASILFDLGSTYSSVSSYLASYLIVPHDSLSALVYVSIPVGDAIVVDRVYRSCVVTIWSLEIRVDLLLLEIVDFDVILGMDWLSPYHAILYCHAKVVTLALQGLPRLEWRENLGNSGSRVISYVKGSAYGREGVSSFFGLCPRF
ncbi:uncharacterized protein [Nicotiana tomentosiformis]|uniref:uncharacterized protein n=1 Tax=Nicotiana tomentosiformis TaxID=4098 RepID=UPI00388C9903